MRPTVLRRTLYLLPVLALLLTLPMAANAAPSIQGDYVEARTADVWTGPCYANGEVGLTGHEAILAWRVAQGSWQGVDLSGLAVAAVVSASATLGDPHSDPLPARALLFVDEAADAEQRRALEAFAREMGGDLLGDVQRVEAAPMAFSVDGQKAHVAAGGVAELQTRPLTHHDKHCGNEIVYYPPLTATTAATPAATVVHAVRTDALGKTWSSPNKRSAFVGRFER